MFSFVFLSNELWSNHSGSHRGTDKAVDRKLIHALTNFHGIPAYRGRLPLTAFEVRPKANGESTRF